MIFIDVIPEWPAGHIRDRVQYGEGLYSGRDPGSALRSGRDDG